MSDPRTLQITDTRVAACFRALGFKYRSSVTIHERTNKAHTQFLFELQSLRFPDLQAQSLHARWISGELRAKEPMHLLCVMMAAQHNYDRLLVLQKESKPQRLVEVPDSGGRLMQYQAGPESMAMEHLMPLDDLRLSASLGVLGIPVLAIQGNEQRRHLYMLAPMGHAVRLDDGRWHQHKTAPLIVRAPTLQDPLRLRLEDTQPLHPLCIAYDALYNRSELKKELERKDGMSLMIDEATHRLTGDGSKTEVLSAKQALISINAPGFVMDQVTAHMKAPPIDWKK